MTMTSNSSCNFTTYTLPDVNGFTGENATNTSVTKTTCGGTYLFDWEIHTERVFSEVLSGSGAYYSDSLLFTSTPSNEIAYIFRQASESLAYFKRMVQGISDAMTSWIRTSTIDNPEVEFDTRYAH